MSTQIVLWTLAIAFSLTVILTAVMRQFLGWCWLSDLAGMTPLLAWIVFMICDLIEQFVCKG